MLGVSTKVEETKYKSEEKGLGRVWQSGKGINYYMSHWVRERLIKEEGNESVLCYRDKY